MVNRDQVAHVAALARLALSDDELDELQVSMQQILSAFETLAEVDVADVLPTAQVIPLASVERPDVIGDPLQRADVLRNAPRVEQEQIRVPAILDEM